MNTVLSLFGIMVLAGLVVGGQAIPPDCPPHLLGVWEYRQAAGDGFDAEGERLELSCSSGALAGMYHGLEREGEHGLFYTLVPVRNLKVTPSGQISFVVPERELFQQRPKNPETVAGKQIPSSGITRDELHFDGSMESSKLVLTCSAKAYSCPERRMVFQR